MNHRRLLFVPLVAMLLSGAVFSQPREVGNLIIDGIPDIPPRIVERMNQYQNVRSAAFLDWNPNGAGMLISTRFAETSQIHYVDHPGGARQQLTFFKEPVGGGSHRVGAGVIGVEYASIFSALGGVEVTLVEKRPGMLEFVDEQIVDDLRYELRRRDVIFRFGEEVESIADEGSRVRAVLKSGKHVVSDALLYAVGRQGATFSLGLETLGLEPDPRGRLQTDAHIAVGQ